MFFKNEYERTVELIDNALDAIEEELRAPVELPPNVKQTHLRLLASELEQARTKIVDRQLRAIFQYGQSRKLISDMWPYDYELVEVILGAYQAVDAITDGRDA